MNDGAEMDEPETPETDKEPVADVAETPALAKPEYVSVAEWQMLRAEQAEIRTMLADLSLRTQQASQEPQKPEKPESDGAADREKKADSLAQTKLRRALRRL